MEVQESKTMAEVSETRKASTYQRSQSGAIFVLSKEKHAKAFKRNKSTRGWTTLC